MILQEQPFDFLPAAFYLFTFLLFYLLKGRFGGGTSRFLCYHIRLSEKYLHDIHEFKLQFFRFERDFNYFCKH
ncbi:hypothetical protein HMPREF9135_0175 [Segatella baroniae F0067]|uniref:Uncharacterized protein n=1 Tax=Segatella baroniae F0067 TaxID=1115809 RepID=U2P7W5_9BACT|nr:hypothetical protein HMPREF9135_0175 [Segatella baroniae F0067]